MVGHCPLTREIDRKNRARSHKDDLIKYIRTAIKGAIVFGLDVAPFQEDLRWVEEVSWAAAAGQAASPDPWLRSRFVSEVTCM